MPKLLVCCEESQRVCMAFRERGWEAYSCDIEPCSGGHPEWHIQQDVLPLINGDCEFDTVDGEHHIIKGEWDLLICHPPCTYLTLAGNKWFKPEFRDRFPDRIKQRQEAIDFFMKFANAKCKHVAIENPVGVMSSQWRKPNQYIEPYYFGDAEKKKQDCGLKESPILNQPVLCSQLLSIVNLGQMNLSGIWIVCLYRQRKEAELEAKHFKVSPMPWQISGASLSKIMLDNKR